MSTALLTALLAGLVLTACSGGVDPGPTAEGSPSAASSSPADQELELGGWHELVATPDGVLLVNGYPEDETDPGALELWRRHEGGWTRVDAPDGPSGRNFAGVAVDQDSGDVVVHGGLTADGVSDETWVYGDGWTRVEGPGPGPRSSPGMAYDEESRLTLLYGGDDGSAQYSDTWAFDGSRWEQVAESGPQPDRWPAAFEGVPGGGVVMYGGHQVEVEDGPSALAGTWLWRGGDWREVRGAVQPGPLVNSAAVVHPTHGLLLLGGGDLRSRERGRAWRWTGTQWRALPPDLVPARQAFGAAYDASRAVVVLSGGLVEPGSTERHQDVWEWSGDPGRPAERVG